MLIYHVTKEKLLIAETAEMVELLAAVLVNSNVVTVNVFLKVITAMVHQSMVMPLGDLIVQMVQMRAYLCVVMQVYMMLQHVENLLIAMQGGQIV